MIDLENFGSNLLKARKERGLSAEEVGQELDPPVVKATISNWENNINRPDLKHINQLAQKYRTDVEALLGLKVISDDGEKFDCQLKFWEGFLSGILLRNRTPINNTPIWDLYWGSLIGGHNRFLLQAIDDHWKEIQHFLKILEQEARRLGSREYQGFFVRFVIYLVHYMNNRLYFDERVYYSEKAIFLLII